MKYCGQQNHMTKVVTEFIEDIASYRVRVYLKSKFCSLIFTIFSPSVALSLNFPLRVCVYLCV